jgi:hypothetical protein
MMAITYDYFHRIVVAVALVQHQSHCDRDPHQWTKQKCEKMNFIKIV